MKASHMQREGQRIQQDYIRRESGLLDNDQTPRPQDHLNEISHAIQRPTESEAMEVKKAPTNQRGSYLW